MKHKLFKTMVAASSVAMICACGDDSGNSSEPGNGTEISSNSAQAPGGNNGEPGNNPVNDPCAKYKVIAAGWIEDIGNGEYLVIDQATAGTGRGTVYDANGEIAPYYFYQEDVEGHTVGHVYELINGEPDIWIDMNMAVKQFCQANTAPDGTPLSSASADPQDPNNPNATTSSASVNPGDPNATTSSASVNPNDTTTTPTESSSSVNTDPELDENGFPTIESYGAPPAEYTKEIRNNGQTGWNSRYWDGCKPHCSWLSSVDTTSEETFQAGLTVARNCNVHDVEVPAYTLGHAVQQYWMGYEGTNSACDTKDPTGTFACTDMAPIAVNDTLSYAYVAGSGKQYQYGCGKCYHLQYNGGKNDGDVKKTHKALNGKHIVVMVSNIGYDVEVGQFDLLIPGGGVGAFDALSTQLGLTDNSVLGANGGGIGRVCFEQVGWDGEVADFQKCIIDGCEKAFSKWPNLLRGCKWYAEWYMAADNPTYNWEEVDCPQYLVDHYMTTINTTKDNRFRWRDDWSTYKKGDELETQECLTDEYPKGCGP